MKIAPIVRKALIKDIDESYEDMLYWLSKTPKERMAALTKLRAVDPDIRLDKTVLIKRNLHP